MDRVFRAMPVDPEKLDNADRVFSELLCDPHRVHDVSYHLLDELSQRSAYLKLARVDEGKDEWRDQEGRTVPPDYRHYKDKPLDPNEDTQLTTNMFELD